MSSAPQPRLGLWENRYQFWLLVLVNAFVGAMVGLERTVLPLLADAEFGIASRSAALSFIATFGVVKALANLLAGHLGDLYGRKRVLLAGWVLAIPVPFLVMWAPTWSWIVFANVLLGAQQGLAWSTTVIMKIDLVGPERRGLAMGLNEFGGYLAVAASALATGYVAEVHGLRPEPFYMGIGFVVAGLGLSAALVRDTRAHVALEADRADLPAGNAEPVERRVDGTTTVGRGGHARGMLRTREVLALGSWRDPALSTASHAGMINNLNDGVAWGLLPIFFAAAGLTVGEIGVLAFVYPAVWGMLQLGTGALSDRLGRRWLIVGGMVLQGAALAGFAASTEFGSWAACAALLGVGTAMVYPTLLASVGDIAHPRWRGSAVGVYRLWRDGGYAVGALLAGVLSDLFGMTVAIWAVAGLTLLSGVEVAWRMPETLPREDGTYRPE